MNGSQRVSVRSDLSRRPRTFSFTASSNHLSSSYGVISVLPYWGLVVSLL